MSKRNSQRGSFHKKSSPGSARNNHDNSNNNNNMNDLQEDEIDIAFRKKGMMAYPKDMRLNRPSSKPKIQIVKDVAEAGSSSDSDIILPVPTRTDYKTRQRRLSNPNPSQSGSAATGSQDTDTSFSPSSLASSISRFRDDFDELKCKMRIFGESLNLCRCLAHDFKSKLGHMERRLLTLERRERISTTESNYSAIIKKNKDLANKTKAFVKKLQMCGTEEEMREVAARICRDYLPGAWKTVEPKELQFRRISGGLSNYIYYVALPENTDAKQYKLYSTDPDGKGLGSPSEVMDDPKKVLLRIYGQIHGERAMDAIVTESVIFTLLSERKLGPKLYGVFSGGRIEEYIPARCLLTKELSEPAISMKIAEKTAAIHSMDIPLSKEPAWMWKTMGRWLRTCKEERLAAGVSGKNEDEQAIIKRLRGIDFDKEVEWLKKYLATVESPVVFCHNDLQEGNILILEDDVPPTQDEFETSYVQTFDSDAPRPSVDSNYTNSTEQAASHDNQASNACRSVVYLRSVPYVPLPEEETCDTVGSAGGSDGDEPRLVLIDFEYCAYNYRGFDLANHMAEWGYDYTNPVHPFYLELSDNWPTLEQKEIFIKEYLKHYTALTEGKDPTEPSIDAVNKLLGEVEAFTLASHFFWGLWSIVNASKSQIPFGYWEYAVSRLETYLRLKQEVIKKDKYGYSQKRKIEEVDI